MPTLQTVQRWSTESRRSRLRMWSHPAGIMLAVMVLGGLVVPSAWAQDTELASGWLSKVHIHGFGSWATGQTDGNAYLSGEEDQSYDSRNFALNIRAEPTEKLAINLQAFWGPSGEESELVGTIDFAFAEWTVSDSFQFRGGVVKQPFGIYTEIFDVGTVRPFFSLPQSIYGPGEFVAEGYQGVGFTGTVRLSDRWDLQYDVYGGVIRLASTEAANPLLSFHSEGGLGAGEGLEESEAEEEPVELVGGRLIFGTPVSGLSFGLSSYHGDPKEEGAEHVSTLGVYGAHLQYLQAGWEIRSEWAHRDGGDEDVEVDSYYLELAYWLNAHWQLAARYDYASWSLTEGREDVLLAPSLLDHRDIALGVNYWLSPGFVLKLSAHQVDGNLYAVPGLEGDLDDLGELDPETELIELGLQFSF